MCNLYQTAKSADLIARAFPSNLRDLAGNVPWPEDVYPDRTAPIIRHEGDGLAVAKARWGMPTPPMYLKTARDPGVTNVRNVRSPHWRRWLSPEHRCLVPVVRFSEPGKDHKPVWFDLVDERIADKETVISVLREDRGKWRQQAASLLAESRPKKAFFR